MSMKKFNSFINCRWGMPHHRHFPLLLRWNIHVGRHSCWFSDWGIVELLTRFHYNLITKSIKKLKNVSFSISILAKFSIATLTILRPRLFGWVLSTKISTTTNNRNWTLAHSVNSIRFHRSHCLRPFFRRCNRSILCRWWAIFSETHTSAVLVITISRVDNLVLVCSNPILKCFQLQNWQMLLRKRIFRDSTGVSICRWFIRVSLAMNTPIRLDL